MLKRYLPFIALIVVIIACSKGKLETRPSIEIKNINASALPDDQDFLITIKYRDKEGDLGNGQLTYIRNRLNTSSVINDLADTVVYPIPDFPKATDGEFELRINAGFLNERPKRIPVDSTRLAENNDTVSFKIFVKDLAGNISDTVATSPLVQIDNP
jgi:hypothetical protein